MRRVRSIFLRIMQQMWCSILRVRPLKRNYRKSPKLARLSHSNLISMSIAIELDTVDKILDEVSQQFRRARPVLQNQFVQPRSLRETQIANIWEEVLHLDSVGVNDSFLALGGQSLHAAGDCFATRK